MSSARVFSTALPLLTLLACGKAGDGVAMSKNESANAPVVPVPAADGPRLGAIAHTTPVREAPNRKATIIGYLHAGATVARDEDPYSAEDCDQGWYPIRPRGFVCLNEGATLDLRHPTLATMAIQPTLDAIMPYTYARTKEDAPVFEVEAEKDRAIRRVGKMPSRSGAAIVGSWEAADEEGQSRKLAMLTDGRFIDSNELERANFSQFQGVDLQQGNSLPYAFVLKRGIATWDISGPTLKRQRELEFHEELPLTGRFRTTHSEKFWEIDEQNWVRHRDVTVLRARTKFPEFVKPGRRWVDVSVIAGTAVAYEGETPVYGTLVTVGADRLGEDTPGARVTERGEFPIVSKHITALSAKPKGFANRVEIHDAPWALELASGQLVHGSYWYTRFGIEHGPGNLQFSPADARWLWQWIGPEVPAGWHAVLELPKADDSPLFNIRK